MKIEDLNATITMTAAEFARIIDGHERTRADVQRDRDRVAKDRDIAVASFVQMRAERDKARAEIAPMIVERDKAIADRDAAIAKIVAHTGDYAWNQICRLERERDEHLSARGDAVRAMRLAMTERDGAVAERDRVIATVADQIAKISTAATAFASGDIAGALDMIGKKVP